MKTLVYNKSTRTFSERTKQFSHNVVKIGDEVKVLADSTLGNLMRPWTKYNMNPGRHQRPGDHEPEVLYRGSKERCDEYVAHMNTPEDTYGVIVNEQDFDRDHKNKETKSVGYKKTFKTKSDAIDYYDAKWRGQEYYLVLWNGSSWIDVN